MTLLETRLLLLSVVTTTEEWDNYHDIESWSAQLCLGNIWGHFQSLLLYSLYPSRITALDMKIKKENKKESIQTEPWVTFGTNLSALETSEQLSNCILFQVNTLLHS